MRELEGRSYTEIADLLGVTVSAVETLIFRARRALREQLEAALTCGQAEQLLSLQLDGELGKEERAQLRAHVRECAACRRLARSQRAQRSALRSLGALPLPSSLASLLGGTAPIATKVAVAVVTASVASGVGYDLHHQLSLPRTHSTPPHAAVHHAKKAPAAPAQAAAVTHVPGTAAVTTAHPTAAHHVRVRHHGKPSWARHPQQQQQQPSLTTVSTPAVAPPTVTHPSHPAQSHAQSHARTHARTQHPPARSHGTSSAPPKKKTGNPHAAAGLTKSSHTKAARNPGTRHLHP
jgi:predicted transcriptional regulator